MPNRTLHTIATSEGIAQFMACALIGCSKWFSMTPLPDDQWRFEVKDESGLPDFTWYTQRGQRKVTGAK